MSAPMTPDRLAEIRERLASTLAPRKAEVAELLAEVDRLNARVGWYHGELTGSNLTAWETEQENGLLRTALESAGREPQWAARVRLAWESARRGRRDVRLRCELAEAECRALRARVAELEAQAHSVSYPPLWVADYDSAPLTLHVSREAARAACDDIAQLDAHGRCWDWRTEEGDIDRQFWTHPDDDRPEGYTGGAVWQVEVESPDPLSPWERAVAGLNALVDAGVDFHVEPDGHISAPFSEEHIEWDLKAKRWVLTHDEHDGGSDV